MRDFPKCQLGFDGGIDTIEAKRMIFTFSDRNTANYCWANSVNSLCVGAVCVFERIHL